MKKLFVVAITSESGDVFAPLIFDKQPSIELLEKILRDRFPEEFPTEDEIFMDNIGPGFFGSYLNLTFYTTQLIEA